MLSESIKKYAENSWQSARKSLGAFSDVLNKKVSSFHGDEAVLLKLLCGTLPVSDLASVSFDILSSFARHALFLRLNSPYCVNMPEDIFLHFVFYPRINNEDLVDCRPFFYDLIANRVKNMNERDAVLEINRWCCENMTYQVSDNRTENPVTAYLSGLGRCGEESVFCVSALRSVGIAARQVYAPFWAHCDDNHAWVEAFIDGKWAFIGACEPEPVLNRGWFNDAASRAPIEHYRTFFDYTDVGMADEKFIGTQGISRLYNVTSNYAKTSDLTLTVRDSSGNPVSDAEVYLEVVNMAAFRPVLTSYTDNNGQIRVDIGRFTAHVEVVKDNLFAETELEIAGDACECVVILHPRVSVSGILNLEYCPSEANSQFRTQISTEQKDNNDKIISDCNLIRNCRIQSYFLPEYEKLDSEWKNIMRLAGGNASEIFNFYKLCAPEFIKYAKEMLQVMAAKDYRDISCETLFGHLGCALKYSDREHFTEEILNPRIENEVIENWRPVLADAFLDSQKSDFIREPQLFMNYIRENYPSSDARYYPALIMSPCAVLSAGCSDERGRRILFVAGMRSFGVAARINPCDGSAEYWRNKEYHCVTKNSGSSCGVIRLTAQSETRFVYGENYTLSRLDESIGHYFVLDYSDSFSAGETFKNPLHIFADSGKYRLLTTLRLPDGSQRCRVSYFVLNEKETIDVPLIRPSVNKADMLKPSFLEPFYLYDASGSYVNSQTVLNDRTLLIFLEVGKEPSEHILNEIIAASDALSDAVLGGLNLIYVLHGEKELNYPTLKESLKAVSGASVYYDDFKVTPVNLAKSLLLEAGVFPLLILTDESYHGYYGVCGYQVGTIEMVLNLNQCVNQ